VLAVPGVIALGDLNGAGLVFGAGVSGGYGNTTGNTLGDPSGYISVVQPYAGIFQTRPRHKVLAEYSPTIDLYNQDKWDGDVLQRGGIRAFDDLSRTWRWVFAGYATSGTEYLRELSGLGMGLYPGWLTMTQPSHAVFASTATTGLHWRSGPRQEFSFTGSDTYNSVRDGPHYDAGFARVQMTNFFGHGSEWYVLGQASRFSNQPDCTRIEPGVGLVFHINAPTTLAVEGAPLFGTGDCVIRLTSDFSGSLIERITPKTYIYLGAGRDLIEPYLLQSKWTDVFFAKLHRRTSQNTSFAMGVGYAQSSDLPDAQLSRYRGFQAFSEFNWRLSESLKLVASYRYFKRDFNFAHDFTEPSFDARNSWVFLSLVWHPSSRSERHAD